MSSASRSPGRVLAALIGGAGLLAGSLLSAGPAAAATGFYIRGAGDGHGIGLSQYGSLGFAQHGFSYTQILGHYYAGSVLGATDPARPVTVLLRDGGSGSFTGAAAAGRHHLSPARAYSVRSAGGDQVSLFGPRGKLGTFTAPLVVTGPGPLSVGGHEYRGSLQFRPDGSGGIDTINAVGLEDYLRGVVPAEMPASWPAAALEAQAVAARTYAITAGAAGSSFQVFSDTRSQMYSGVSVETPATDAAIAATRGRVVTVAGQPAVTYFFASSGGHTEDVQNVWSGVSPESWLVGVPDPYDNAGGNPYYRWKIGLTMTAAARDLGSLLKGGLRGIQVTQRGASPRVVSAVVVGSGGRTTVTGSQLEQAFSLMSTYASFTSITTRGVNSSGTPTSSSTPNPGSGPGGPGSGPTSGGSGVGAGSGPPGATGASLGSGGASFGNAFRRAPRRATPPVLSGSIFPGRRGEVVTIERLGRHGYRALRRVRLGTGGGYRVALGLPGRYRVLEEGVAGPAITLR